MRASLGVLEALARALGLTPAERTHLILLGRGEEPPPCKSEERVSPTVRRTIEGLGQNPAYVLGRRWDYLAWNDATVALFGDLGAVPRASRNHVWMHFMDPEVPFRPRNRGVARPAPRCVPPPRRAAATPIGTFVPLGM